MDTAPTPRVSLLKGVAVALCLALGGASAFAMSALRVKGVSPADGTFTNKRQLALSAHYEGRAASAVLLVDGKPVATEVRADQGEVVARADGLSNGSHRVALQLRGVLGLRRVDHEWSVTVDATAPVITLEAPAVGAIVKDRKAAISGRTKPHARLRLRVTAPGHAYEVPTVEADASGQFTATANMGDDDNKIRIDAVDLAGNRATLVRTVMCDLAPPAVSDLYPAPDAVIKLDPTVTLRARVTETGSGIQRAVLVVDGKEHALSLPSSGGEVRFQAEGLPEGTREIALEVEDKAGWKVRKDWSFLVDTVETFGIRPATRGARGKDVETLQKRLSQKGDLEKGHLTSVFDDETEKALQHFQARSALDVDGALGLATVARLSPRIDVDLSTFTLTLYDDDKKVKTYRIACGMPAYPTPTGKYRITFLERNPTWIPPKGSLWAREAKVTPPGPGNPLGTRWIGLDSNAVGIHGTNAEWTVGSRASHGCLRMRIADVEDLFERVNAGARVVIHDGKVPLSKN